MIPNRNTILRFMLVAVSASVFIFCLAAFMAFLEFGLPDTDLPPYPAPTTLQRVDDAIGFIATLPSSAIGLYCTKCDIKLPVDVRYLLLVAPGLFWASVFEMLYRTCKRYVA